MLLPGEDYNFSVVNGGTFVTPALELVGTVINRAIITHIHNEGPNPVRVYVQESVNGTAWTNCNFQDGMTPAGMTIAERGEGGVDFIVSGNNRFIRFRFLGLFGTASGFARFMQSPLSSSIT